MEEKKTFHYTYSARQQEEIKRIRSKYVTPEPDKMEQLRRLDEAATRKGTAASLAAGIIGTLLLGLGMSMIMVWQGLLIIPGVLIGLVGIAILACAYPLYAKLTKKERERIAPEIIRLTDELMN